MAVRCQLHRSENAQESVAEEAVERACIGGDAWGTLEGHMLAEFELVTTIPVVDLQRAKGFYQGVLGLRVTEETPMAVRLATKTGPISLFKRGPTKADHTVAHFEVAAIEGLVEGLRAKGVAFMEYDSGPLQTTRGIARIGGMRAAWLKDTEGNILGLREGSP
jgi:catechol 2,3-dioxygenase-like lactoylglutathione lyase family enzyme